MASLNVERAIAEGNKLLNENMAYRLSATEMRTLVAHCNGKEFYMYMDSFALGFCRGYKAALRKNKKKSSKR